MNCEIICKNCNKSFECSIHFIDRDNILFKIEGKTAQIKKTMYIESEPVLVCFVNCPICNLELKGILDPYPEGNSNIYIIFDIIEDTKSSKISSDIAHAFRNNIISLSAFGFLDQIKIKISEGESVSKIFKSLLIASQHGQLNIVKFLCLLPNLFTKNNCKKNFSEFRKNIYKTDAFHITIADNDIAPNILSKALEKACISGDLKVIQYLVSLDVDIKSKRNFAVGTAAAWGNLEAIKYLVSVGANYKEPNNYPLVTASVNGHLNVVKYLVSLGVDINQPKFDISRPELLTPILQAKKHGQNDIVEYLISIGCDNMS